MLFRSADTATRAALLEVSAYLCRPSETELAAEVVAELVPMLACPSQDLQLAALRGIRRFPSQETRSAVTQVAAEALLQAEARTAVLTQALQTLSWSKDTPWRAPHDGAVDKASWLQLVRDVCGGSLPKERRTEGLAIALLLDRDNRRVPEVFDLLLDLARDRTKEPEFRTQCLIHLQDWRDQGARTDTLVREAVLAETAAAFERDFPGRVRFAVCDVRDAAAVEAMIDALWHEQPLDALVNNAAGNFIARSETLSSRAEIGRAHV